MTDVNSNYYCPQCPKIFATRSNLKRHMENPNIHNIPYERSRDQKRWKDHSKKVSSRQETTERMRKWRAENREKNKRNDLRCRVYRLARQKFGEEDSEEKQRFVEEEIDKRLGRRLVLEQKKKTLPSIRIDHEKNINELPFYCAPLQKIELPSLDLSNRRKSQSTEPAGYANKSQSSSPISDTSPFTADDRRQSFCSVNSSVSNYSTNSPISSPSDTFNNTILPPMQALLSSSTNHSFSQLE